MARSIRIEYAGAYYHVMARGNRREAIFEDDEDREFFLKILGEACGMTGWRVHAWVLMGNHYHLLIETPEANLVSGMQWLQNTYTRRYNARHKLRGRLFGDRYKAVLVDGTSRYYYETLVDYLHLNPVREGLVRVRKGGSVSDYQWSSMAGGYLKTPGRRPQWMVGEKGLSVFGFRDTAVDRRRFLARLDGRARKGNAKSSGMVPGKEDGRSSTLQRGWYWGTEAFAEKVLKLGKGTLGKRRNPGYRSSHEQRAHGEREAERLLEEGLAAAGLEPKALKGLKGSDPRKVAIGRIIRKRTTVGMKWLAEKLAMGSAANVSQQLKRISDKRQMPGALKEWARLSRNVA